jgi:hypothetical protein
MSPTVTRKLSVSLCVFSCAASNWNTEVLDKLPDGCFFSDADPASMMTLREVVVPTLSAARSKHCYNEHFEINPTGNYQNIAENNSIPVR